MIALLAPIRETWMLLEAGLSGMIVLFIANLRNMDASRKGVIRDDDCGLLTGLKGRDASRTGTYQG